MRRPLRLIAALALAPLPVLTAALIAAPAAVAQVIAPQPIMDQVSLTLTQEDWVRTETARVVLVVDAAGNGGGGGSVRGEVLKAAAALADRADWKVVSFDRRQDEAGLDRWQAVLEARLAEAQLGGLDERAKKTSRPGLQLRVQEVDFTPTLAEMEAARGRLRTEIYRKVTDEPKAVNDTFPGRAFRVAHVNFEFGTGPVPVPMKRARTAQMSAAAPEMADAGGAMDVAQKVTLTAHVMLQAVAPTEAGK